MTRTLMLLRSLLLLALTLTACRATGDGAAPPAPDVPMDSPEATVRDLYDTISIAPGEAVDWDRFHGLFHPGGHLAQPSAGEARGVDAAGFERDFQGFLDGSGCGEAGFTEQPVSAEVRAYGGVAVAHVVFEATLGTSPDQARRGLDIVSLVRVGEDWRIVSVLTEWEQPDAPL